MATERKRLINRRDTEANWSSVNPVLAASEIGYSTDTKKFKMGDGVTAWNDLEYYEAGESAAYEKGNGINIDGGTISVNARNTQFAFTTSGEMYLMTRGDSGFVTNKVLNDTITKYVGDIESLLKAI
jgi:Zn/Cd-binding protein ZinT